MSTNVVKAKDIRRKWHKIDAKNKVLGRLAVTVANLLSGKGKTNFVPYLDMGDYVVVTNVSQVKITGKKADQKKYIRHSGYRGGYREEKFSDLLVRRPEEVIKHAVRGMLPKNRLADKMITRLFIFANDKHTYSKQLGEEKKGEEEAEVVSATV